MKAELNRAVWRGGLLAVALPGIAQMLAGRVGEGFLWLGALAQGWIWLGWPGALMVHLLCAVRMMGLLAFAGARLLERTSAQTPARRA